MATPTYTAKDFPLAAELEKNGINVPRFLQPADDSGFSAKLYSSLPSLPRYGSDLFFASDPFRMPDGRTTPALTIPEGKRGHIFISQPDEGYVAVQDPNGITFVEENAVATTSGPTIRYTDHQYKSLIPFLYWHEKIEFTIGMLVDPDDKINTYEAYEAVHPWMEATADCFAASIVMESENDIYNELAMDIPLTHVANQVKMPKLTPYYVELINATVFNPVEREEKERLFLEYVEKAKKSVEEFLG